jgi:hypothetical protein
MLVWRFSRFEPVISKGLSAWLNETDCGGEMMSAKPEALPTAESIAKYVKQSAPKLKKSSAMMKMMHQGGQEIVRQDDYKGHHVVVRTVYHITIDGVEVTGHIMLTNDGQV